MQQVNFLDSPEPFDRIGVYCDGGALRMFESFKFASRAKRAAEHRRPNAKLHS